MPLLKPDPSFYPSPRLAMEAPPEKHAFVAALNPPGGKLNDALLVVDVDPKSRTYGNASARSPCLNSEMNSIISAGMPAARRSARTLRTRMSSVDIWWCPGCALRGFILWIPNPTPET